MGRSTLSIWKLHAATRTSFIESLKKLSLRNFFESSRFDRRRSQYSQVFKDFYYETDKIPPFNLEPSVEIDELMRVIEENIHHAAAGTDILPTDFYYQFYIMIQRSAQKNYLDLSTLDNMDWQSDVNYQYFLSLKPKIRNYYGFEIPDQELLGLYLFSICKRTIDSPLKEQVFVQQFNLWPNLKELSVTFL